MREAAAAAAAAHTEPHTLNTWLQSNAAVQSAHVTAVSNTNSYMYSAYAYTVSKATMKQRKGSKTRALKKQKDR